MKQFENGQKVMARYGTSSFDNSWKEFVYIGPIPGSSRPHAVRNELEGLKAIYDGDIKPAPTKRQGWINVYASGEEQKDRRGQIIYDTEAEAELAGNGHQVATTQITWEE